MGNVKATFIFDAELFAAFKHKCEGEGRTMTWYLTRCIKDIISEGMENKPEVKLEPESKPEVKKRSVRPVRAKAKKLTVRKSVR